jgi:hypothetical protein
LSAAKQAGRFAFYARCRSASGRENDAFRNAVKDFRRSTTTAVPTIGVDCATHCMHISEKVTPRP